MPGCSISVWLFGVFLLPSAAVPETHHGIVFDAGSSGSRIHVYTWVTGGASEFELIEDDLVKVKPGLSAFADDPSRAGSSLSTLLAHAETKVPSNQRAATPIFLMATAGLRSVGDDTAKKILDNVRETLAATSFLFRNEWAFILSGNDEGVFGWVTVNYLLETLTAGGVKETSGVIDLGGGSVQLAYTAPRGIPILSADTGEVLFAGHKHNLYAKSFSGFGLDEARARVAGKLAWDAAAGPDTAVEHPCLPAGHKEPEGVGKVRQNLVGTGSYNKCVELYASLFGHQCAYPPCLFRPDRKIPLPYPKTFVGFSYLYDRTKAIGLLDGKPEEFGSVDMTIADISAAAKKLCGMQPFEVKTRFTNCEDAAKWANFCGDTVYIALLLETGFEIDQRTSLTMANKIGGVELVWTLGAIIAKSAALPQLLEEGAQKQEL